MVAAVAVVAEVLSEFLCPRDLTAALSACPTGTVTSLEARSSPARHAGGLACQYLAAVRSAQQTAFSYNGKGGREIFTGHTAMESGAGRSLPDTNTAMGRAGRSLLDTTWGLTHLDGFGAHLTVDLLFPLNVVKAEV